MFGGNGGVYNRKKNDQFHGFIRCVLCEEIPRKQRYKCKHDRHCCESQVRTCYIVEFNELAGVIICNSDGRVPCNEDLCFCLNQWLYPMGTMLNMHLHAEYSKLLILRLIDTFCIKMQSWFWILLFLMNIFKPWLFLHWVFTFLSMFSILSLKKQLH